MIACEVIHASKSAEQTAEKIAEQLGLPLARSYSESRASVALVVDTHEVWLQPLEKPRPGRVTVDFSSPDMRHRRKSGHNEPLGRAVGVKADRKPRVFDATAGLGRDAFVLADLGCEVELSEVSPVLYFLLKHAHETALLSASEKVVHAAQRMTISHRDSARCSVSGFNTIYLDPMFPDRSKSAAVKKDLAAVQSLLASQLISSEVTQPSSTDKAVELLNWALSQPVERVVVKRPVKSPHLGGIKPSHSITGKTVRFDVLVRPVNQ
ncbi:MAG: class I SAM-dependent methyltransferase [Halieaceae bacterium]